MSDANYIGVVTRAARIRIRCFKVRAAMLRRSATATCKSNHNYSPFFNTNTNHVTDLSLALVGDAVAASCCVSPAFLPSTYVPTPGGVTLYFLPADYAIIC